MAVVKIGPLLKKSSTTHGVCDWHCTYDTTDANDTTRVRKHIGFAAAS